MDVVAGEGDVEELVALVVGPRHLKVNPELERLQILALQKDSYRQVVLL